MRAPLLACALLAGACSRDALDPVPPDASSSLDLAHPASDASSPPTCETPNACGDCDPACRTLSIGPSTGAPFPLPNDMPPDPHVASNGVGRDNNGYLTIDGSGCFCGGCGGDVGWLANSTDWGRGTVSRINTKTVRELARYLSVTCGSLKTGSTAACDGQNGCCAADDLPRFAARLAMQLDPGHQPVQLADNYPSRTSVDFTADVWVENRAPGGQPSITKISFDTTTCPDRNKNGKIDTSADKNGDGLIQTDCNDDGEPDDIASVKAKPCTNNLAQEFYGLDDECVLLTTNIGAPDSEGRALALGPGAQDFGPSDPWAGTRDDATLYRTDGTTGQIKDRAMLPAPCKPDGMTLDASAIAWTTPDGPGALCWFNAKKPSDQGQVRSPQTGDITARVIALDRDQNLWLADRTTSGAYRYTPDRTAGTTMLGAGFWTRITNSGQAAGVAGTGTAIALDSRSPNDFFAWLAIDQGNNKGWLVRIPASTIPLPKGMDQTIDGTQYPATALPGFTPVAVGIDPSQNAWVISRAPSAMIRLLVDLAGTAAPPDLVSPPMGQNRCPAGARCLLKDNMLSEPGTDSYSDFFGYLLRNLCRPKGLYQYIFDGACPIDQFTEWYTITWDSVVPLNTSLTAQARAGATPRPDPTWGAWTGSFPLSPADLIKDSPLVPNRSHESRHLQVEMDFTTMDKNARPKLKNLQVAWKCFTPL